MPLWDRERNLAHVVSRMREYSNDLFEGVNSDGLKLDMESEADGFPEILDHFANLIETLQFHGTRGYYQKGCHCDWCREALNQYVRRRGGRVGLRLVRSPLLSEEEMQDL